MSAQNDLCHRCGVLTLPRQLRINIHEQLWSKDDTLVDIEDSGVELAIRSTCRQIYIESKAVYERATSGRDV